MSTIISGESGSILLGPNFERYRLTEQPPFDLWIEDEEGYLGVKMSGFHGGSGGLERSLRCVFDRYDLFTPSGDKPQFLDLGSNIAVQVIWGAHHGWDSYGIEFSARAHQYGLHNIAKAVAAGFIDEQNAHVALGNFYPQTFARLERKRRREMVSSDEYLDRDKVPEIGYISHWQREINRFEKETTNENPYKKLGLDLGDVDLFYHYQVQPYELVMSFFTQFAKTGAYLLFSRSLSDEPNASDSVVCVEKCWTILGKHYVMDLWRKVE